MSNVTIQQTTSTQWAFVPLCLNLLANHCVAATYINHKSWTLSSRFHKLLCPTLTRGPTQPHSLHQPMLSPIVISTLQPVRVEALGHGPQLDSGS